jgi:ankyrin repeat protein
MAQIAGRELHARQGHQPGLIMVAAVFPAEGDGAFIHPTLPGYKEVVQLLLANKAQVNAKDNNGITPLNRAVLQGRRDIAELLRLYGGHN